MTTLGRLDEAITLGEAGDALHRRLGIDARSAQSSTELGEQLLRRDKPGDRARAEALLGDAADLAEHLGMVPTAARARQLSTHHSTRASDVTPCPPGRELGRFAQRRPHANG